MGVGVGEAVGVEVGVGLGVGVVAASSDLTAASVFGLFWSAHELSLNQMIACRCGTDPDVMSFCTR